MDQKHFSRVQVILQSNFSIFNGHPAIHPITCHSRIGTIEAEEIYIIT